MQPLYQWFYHKLPVHQLPTDGAVHLLSATEAARLRTLERRAIIVAALLGAAGVLFLYIPRYLWPQLFPDYTLVWKEKTYQIPVIFTCWSALLVFLEITALTLLHIYCMHEMAVATGFMTYESKGQPRLQQQLMQVSREQKDKSIERYGIDPLLEMNRRALLFWNLLLTLKATLTNLFFRFVVQRMMGRYAFQWVQDMAGIPVFAAWNAWGSIQVLRQGRIIIMGQNLVELAVQRLTQVYPPASADTGLMFETLELVAVSKRDYHANHAVLVAQLIQTYHLEKPNSVFSRHQYLQHLMKSDPRQQQLCSFLLVLGFLLDGTLSRIEKKRYQELQGVGLKLPPWDQLISWKNAFLNGQPTHDLWTFYDLHEPISEQQ